MKNKLNVILLVAVFLLAVHSIYLSIRLSAISEKADIDHLKVKRIDLVGPTGKITGEITAGNDDQGPRIKLLQADRGNQCTLGFAADRTGPLLEMWSEFPMMEGAQVPEADRAQSMITLGAVGYNYQGLWIQGRESAPHEMMLGWEIDQDNNSGQYVYPCPVDRPTPLTSNNARVVTVEYDPDGEPNEENR